MPPIGFINKIIIINNKSNKYTYTYLLVKEGGGGGGLNMEGEKSLIQRGRTGIDSTKKPRFKVHYLKIINYSIFFFYKFYFLI